jgi:hypothetical protein
MMLMLLKCKCKCMLNTMGVTVRAPHARQIRKQTHTLNPLTGRVDRIDLTWLSLSPIHNRELKNRSNSNLMHPRTYDRTPVWVRSFYYSPSHVDRTRRWQVEGTTPDARETMLIVRSFLSCCSLLMNWPDTAKVSLVPVFGHFSVTVSPLFFVMLSPNQVPTSIRSK